MNEVRAKQTYKRYWAGLIAFMKARDLLLVDWEKAISNTTRQRVFKFPNFGDALRISAGASPGIPSESPYIQVDLTPNPNTSPKSVFLSWYDQQDLIDAEINSDPPLQWDTRDEEKESWAKSRKPAVLHEEGAWENQYEWLAENLVALHEAVKKRIKKVYYLCRTASVPTPCYRPRIALLLCASRVRSTHQLRIVVI